MRNLIRLRLAMLTLLVAIVSATCGPGSEVGTREPETVELGEQDSESTVPLRAGDQLLIRLDSNVTTGFAWAIVSEPATEVLELVGSEYVEPETGMLGAGGQELWTFVATGEGVSDLELSYDRASGETSGRTFVVTIEVAPAD
jgi:predicted secreted protein